MSSPELNPNRWRAFAVVGTAFFMTILDAAIANVALPSIGRDLGFTTDDLQWVVTAYVIMYGGFRSLRGWAADLLRGAEASSWRASIRPSPRRRPFGLSNRHDADLRPRLPGAGAAITAAGRALDRDEHVPGGRRSGNQALGIWGAPAWAPRSGCCWAASSPSTPPGSGSSS